MVGDALCQVAVDAILKTGHTGKIGDGKVFVQDLGGIIRIRTEGFNRLGPSLYCGVFLALSIHLLNLAVRNLGGRVGIGMLGTVAHGALMVIGGIAGLKLVDEAQVA